MAWKFYDSDGSLIGGTGRGWHIYDSTGAIVGSGGGGGDDHNLLDGDVHTDTVADTVSEGSLIYGNATPKWDELVIGDEGDVLTVDSGLPVWAAPAGGGGSLGIWIPDAPPASAGALDDEFADASGGVPGGWTEYDHGSVGTVTENADGVRIHGAGDGSDTLMGIYKADPGGNFTIWSKLGVRAIIADDFCTAGIYLFEDATSSTGNVHRFVITIFNGGTVVQSQLFTAYNTFSTSSTLMTIGHTGWPSGCYMRLRRTSTTYELDISHNGVHWIRCFSNTISFTPAHVGLGTSNRQTNDASAFFQFFRYKNSDVGFVGVAEGDRV